MVMLQTILVLSWCLPNRWRGETALAKYAH